MQGEVLINSGEDGRCSFEGGGVRQIDWALIQFSPVVLRYYRSFSLIFARVSPLEVSEGSCMSVFKSYVI